MPLGCFVCPLAEGDRATGRAQADAQTPKERGIGPARRAKKTDKINPDGFKTSLCGRQIADAPVMLEFSDAARGGHCALGPGLAMGRMS